MLFIFVIIFRYRESLIIFDTALERQNKMI